MKKILWLLLMVGMFVSCSDNDDPEVVPHRHSGRTVLAFFWANNNLSDDLRLNIHDMMYGLIQVPDSSSVLVYWDGKSNDPNWKTPAIVEYHTDGDGRVNGFTAEELDGVLESSRGSVEDLVALGEIKKVYPDQLSSDVAVMQRVLKDMISYAPSDRYGLILGSHGSGWLPSITGTRSIGQDGSYTNNTVQISELAAVLKSVCPQKFDFLLFDACMMGSAEVYYELREVTRYCVASVLDVPAGGMPYAELMLPLFHNDLEPSLETVCKRYLESKDGQSWGTVSLVDCSQMEALAQATRTLLQDNQMRMADVPLRALQEYGRERGFNDTFVGIHCDMVQYLERLTGTSILPDAFGQAFDAAVRYTGYTPNVGHGCYDYEIDGNHYCGMGMYIPYYPMSASKAEFWNGYFETAVSWYAAAGWADTKVGWGAAR